MLNTTDDINELRQLERKKYFLDALNDGVEEVAEEYHTSGVYKNQEINQFIDITEKDILFIIQEKIKAINKELTCTQKKFS